MTNANITTLLNKHFDIALETDIDQLMNLCNDLEAYIKNSGEKKKSILNSVLAKI